MEETVKDFLEQQEERNLLARTGRTRPLSKPGLPSHKEWAAQNGPVITKTLPALPTTAARVRWLKARDDLTNEEFARKTGVSAATLSRIFSGHRARASTLQEISKSFDVPLVWLMGAAQTPAEPAPGSSGQTPRPKPQSQFETCCNTRFRFELTANGEYSGEELRELLGCLVEKTRYNVKINIRAEAPK